MAAVHVVLDVGFSSTHAVPIYGGAPINYAVRRLNVGGKLLTNQLKTIVSYRSFNVMQETHVINDVKERLCYVRCLPHPPGGGGG